MLRGWRGRRSCRIGFSGITMSILHSTTPRDFDKGDWPCTLPLVATTEATRGSWSTTAWHPECRRRSP
eukprot:8493388-Prorocentrum_lima.AAC.1